MSQIAGFDSPASQYTAAQATIVTETAGRIDQARAPAGPDRRAAQTRAGMSNGKRRNPPPIEDMSTTVTTARAIRAAVSQGLRRFMLVSAVDPREVVLAGERRKNGTE